MVSGVSAKSLVVGPSFLSWAGPGLWPGSGWFRTWHGTGWRTSPGKLVIPGMRKAATYKVEISPGLVSQVTEEVWDEVRLWERYRSPRP